MDVLTELKAKVDEFSKKLKTPPMQESQPIPLKVSEIRQFGSVWPEWSKKVGVYVFIGDDKIHYIGRALKGSTFGARIYSQIAPCDDADPWHNILKPNTKIALFAFSNIEDDYWAASLEIYLIDAFWDQVKEFNKRRG